MSEGNIILTHKSLCYYEGCLSHFHIYIFVVAVTVCGNSGWTSHDDYNLMKFPYIKTNIGINNVTSTGIFTCNRCQTTNSPIRAWNIYESSPFSRKKFLSLCSIVKTTEWNGLIKIDN